VEHLLLHHIPEVVAYADDFTIHISYAKEHTQENSERLQWIIDLATKWGKLWKVHFAATKSQSYQNEITEEQKRLPSAWTDVY